MAKYKIAWLPGDGIGVDVLDAAKIVLDKIQLDAEYVHGDIGWEFCNFFWGIFLKNLSGAFAPLHLRILFYR